VSNRWKPRSLAQRVVLSVVLGSLLAGVIVAGVTVVLANRLAREQEDHHLLAAAGTLAFELDVKRYDPLYAVADETRELAHTGMLVALFESGRLLAGAASLPFVPPGTCQSTPSLRVCAVGAQRWVALAGRSHTRLRAHSDVTLKAAVTALLGTSLLSTGLALLLAFAAVKPLDKLTRALSQLPVHAREDPDLGPASGVYEVDTLRASLQAALNASRRALARSRSFTGDAAHQLRTPLATLIAELDLALEGVDDASKGECTRARLEATRLSTLIDRLLILANPEDAIQLSTSVSLTQLVEVAIEALPEQERTRVERSGHSVTLEADPTLLLTAIVGALESALECSSGSVRVVTRPATDSDTLSIEDDGPSFTGPEQGARAGDGVWLAVVRRVTALHGAEAHLEGSKLELRFPRLRA
jgi:signal transduction histidine kinase